MQLKESRYSRILAFLLALKVPIIQPGGNFCLKVGMKRAINPWYKTEGKIALAKLTWRTHTIVQKKFEQKDIISCTVQSYTSQVL